MPPFFVGSGSGRVSRQQAKASDLSHTRIDPTLLPKVLNDLILLQNASPELGNLVIRGTVVSRVSDTIAVCAPLLGKASKLKSQHVSSVFNGLNLVPIGDFTQLCLHVPRHVQA